MKLIIFFLYLLIGVLFMDCDRKKESGEITKTIHFIPSEEVEEVDPPDLTRLVKFETMKDWLISLSQNKAPDKEINSFNFGLMESHPDYVVFVVGLNKYEEKDHIETRIDFRPENMYFHLPVNLYGALTRNQKINKLKKELQDFTLTENFKNSFFTKSDFITLNSEEEIWSRLHKID